MKGRNELSLKYCHGAGVELGPGLTPTQVGPGVELAFVDKRSRSELMAYFDVKDIMSTEKLADYTPGAFDFLMAHHVLEHCSNVVATLENWISYLKPTGTLFLSVPNRKFCADQSRLVASPLHFLYDYILGIDDSSFESREHIYSFLWGWHDEGGLKGKNKMEAHDLVNAAAHQASNDLHWHVFTFTTFKYVIEVAAALAGRSTEFLHQYDAGSESNEHRIVVRLRAGAAKDENITFLSGLRGDLPRKLAHISLGFLEGKAAYLLGEVHSGKGLVIEDHKLRWVREAEVYESLGLHQQEPIYVELGSATSDVFGEDIVSSSFSLAAGRAQAVIDRIPIDGAGLELSPGAAPLVNKRDGRIIYCDKFGPKDWPRLYPEGKFVDVDVSLAERALDSVFRKEQFDYIVSSHVIEHIPDFIQFFISSSIILRSGGAIVKLVPDKRYTFDVLRRVSSVQDIEVAHKAKLTSPSDAMIQDFYRNCDMNANAEGLWVGTYKPQRSFTPKDAQDQLEKADRSVVDLHCFTFTPDSFKTLIAHVIEKYVPDLSLIEISNTPRGGNEFLVHLKKNANA
jgi:predicted SAM-dependent methyltransferase